MISHALYNIAGSPDTTACTDPGICRFCKSDSLGISFDKWVGSNFTNWDLLVPGDIVCSACQFILSEQNEQLTKTIGTWWPDLQSALDSCSDRVENWRKKKKVQNDPSPKDIGLRQLWGGWAIPQRMRNYSHFIKDGEWIVLGKDKKKQMADILFNRSPDYSVISVGGQKHILFRARPGFWQFEETSVRPSDMAKKLYSTIVPMLAVFSKSEIESRQYNQKRISDYGLFKWNKAEQFIKRHRGGIYFKIAIFLSTKQGEGA